jgi:flagellar hook assembly protein FlgD
VDDTTIHYHVPDPGTSVRLRLLNSRGAVVRTLVDDPTHSQGTRAVTWNGRDDAGRRVGSGVYFYELSIGSWQQIGKVVLLR